MTCTALGTKLYLSLITIFCLPQYEGFFFGIPLPANSYYPAFSRSKPKSVWLKANTLSAGYCRLGAVCNHGRTAATLVRACKNPERWWQRTSGVLSVAGKFEYYLDHGILKDSHDHWRDGTMLSAIENIRIFESALIISYVQPRLYTMDSYQQVSDAVIKRALRTGIISDIHC